MLQDGGFCVTLTNHHPIPTKHMMIRQVLLQHSNFVSCPRHIRSCSCFSTTAKHAVI